MKLQRGSTLFLKGVIILIAIGALAAMIRFPQLEGRAANLDLVSIYTDPFIIYGYLASVPFFVALFQTFKLLGYIEHNNAFSQTAVNALRSIKYCALILIAALIAGIVYIRFASGGDDPAGAIAVGICVTFAFVVIATGATVFESLLQNAVDLKSENDLTV
jgi:hypothetical protein